MPHRPGPPLTFGITPAGEAGALGPAVPAVPDDPPYRVELQLRYHPRPDQEGDIGAWVDFVRTVVDRFGPNRRVCLLEDDYTPKPAFAAYGRLVAALARRR